MLQPDEAGLCQPPNVESQVVRLTSLARIVAEVLHLRERGDNRSWW